MRQKPLVSISIIIIILFMFLLPASGSTHVWQFGNGFHYAIDRVCRDGADMIAAFWSGNSDIIPTIDKMLLSAQQYHNDNLPDPQSASYPPNVLYGPLLDRQFVPITYHDEDGIFDEPGAVSTTRISVASDGTQGNGASFAPSISGNGHYTAFESLATIWWMVISTVCVTSLSMIARLVRQPVSRSLRMAPKLTQPRPVLTSRPVVAMWSSSRMLQIW